jgi:hypothetical protein
MDGNEAQVFLESDWESLRWQRDGRFESTDPPFLYLIDDADPSPEAQEANLAASVLHAAVVTIGGIPAGRRRGDLLDAELARSFEVATRVSAATYRHGFETLRADGFRFVRRWKEEYSNGRVEEGVEELWPNPQVESDEDE